MNVQTLTVRKRHRIGFLVVLLGSALTIGCAQTRQTVFSHLWGPDRITFKKTTGKLVKTTGKLVKTTGKLVKTSGKLTAFVLSKPLNSKSSHEDESSQIKNVSDFESDFNKIDRNSIRMAGLARPEFKKPASRSPVVSQFLRRNPLQDELVEDPFLTEYSQSGSETNSRSKENSRLQEVFKQTVKREVADAGRIHDEPVADEPNPFAKFEKRSQIESVKTKISTPTVTSQKPARQTSQFVRDFDSELDRLRGKITKNNTDDSPSRDVVLRPDEPVMKSSDFERPSANPFTLASKPDTAIRNSVDKPMAKSFGNLKRPPKQITAKGISSHRRSFSTNYDKLRQRRASDMVELVPAPAKVEPTPGRMLPEYGDMILETDSVPSRSATRRLSRALRMTSGSRTVWK